MTYHLIESSSPDTSSLMKRLSLLLSTMVLVLLQTSSSLLMTLLKLCPLLLDRCTSFCLQELHPVPPTPPAPLPVPLRPCLGRPWSFQKMLMILRRPRSTSPCATSIGNSHRATLGSQEPHFHATRDHGADWCTQRRLSTPSRPCCTPTLHPLRHPRAPPRLLRHPAGLHRGFHLFARLATSRTTTRVDRDHHRLLLHQPP